MLLCLTIPWFIGNCFSPTEFQSVKLLLALSHSIFLTKAVWITLFKIDLNLSLFQSLTLLLLITPDVWLELLQNCFPTMSLLRRAGCVPHTTTKNSVQGNVLDHTHVLSTHSLTVLPPFNCFIVFVGRLIFLAQKLVFYWSVYFARLSWLKPQPKTETQPSVNCPPFQWCTAAAHVALDGGTHETWFYWDKFKV